MENEEIYDRKELCDNILSQIQNANETQAYILYSGTGVGKTSVSKKIAKLVIERNINKDVIRIKSTQDDTSSEGTFLRDIFHSIRKYYLGENNKNKIKRKKYTYHYYIKHLNFSAITKNFERDNLNAENCNNIRTTIIYFIKLILSFLFVKVEFIENSESNCPDSKIMISYIKYILKKGNIILCIENAQNFDKKSLSILSELIIETKSCPNYFIFEFTLTDCSESKKLLDTIKNELDYSEIKYKNSELNKLELEYVLELAKQLCDPFDSSFLSKIEQMYTGNVKKIVNFAFNYSVHTVNDDDPTFALLQGLSKNQKYIMAIILINNTVISEHLLKQVLNNSNGIYLSDYNKDIEYLISRVGLLENRGNNICVKDKDTVDSWNENVDFFKTFEALAYKNCEAVISRIFENGIEYSLSRKECILLLLQLYSKFDVVQLNNMLQYIDEVIYKIISIDELKKYLKELINILYPREESLNILYNIFDVCSQYQLADLEGLCLDKIKNIIHDKIDQKYLFCYYTNLLQREEYPFLLEQLEKRNDWKADADFKYYIELFKIVAHTSLNHNEECTKIVNALENDLAFHTTLPYGIFLRLAEAYDKRNIAIPKVEKSIAIFKAYHLDIQIAKSQVSLAFLYSITGNLEKADNVLNSAEKILVKNIENKYIFNINKACLCLLKHIYTKNVWDLLCESEQCAYIRFDKIAIIINKIIWCIENKDYDKGKYYEKKGLELLELESNRHLHAIFYYNCYVLYKSMNETAISKEYYERAVANKGYCETLKARLEGKTEVEDQTTFLLQYPWHVCFVSYWYFDYIFKDICSTL